MGKKLFINNKYHSFKKTISIDGDKSISIRALLLGSQAFGKTSIENILLSEDIINFPFLARFTMLFAKDNFSLCRLDPS